MNSIFMQKEEAIELLQKQTHEAFMDIMNKLISDNKWSDNGDFIYFITKKRKIAVDYVAIGIFNKKCKSKPVRN